MKKREFIRFLVIVLIACLFIILAIWTIRLFSAKQLDDVSPEIACEESLLKKSDILYVIPKFHNKSIAENKSWCNYILSLNKTLGMHGVYHTFNEFMEERNEKYINEGEKIFYDCFGFYPQRFEPPQVAISKPNAELISKKMRLDLYIQNVFHKAYHCSDTGIVSNRFVSIF